MRPTGPAQQHDNSFSYQTKIMKHLPGLKAFGGLAVAAFLMIGGALLAGFLAGSGFGG